MQTSIHGYRKFVLGGLMIAACLTSPQARAADFSEILPENAQVEKVAGGFKFTEGPAWHPNGFLLFTDIPNERVIKLDAEGNLSDFFTPSGRSNGLMCDQQGFVYVCQMGDGHVLKLNAQGELLGKLVDTFQGKIMNGPNDLALDGHGGLYFTDPYYGPEKPLPQPMMAVYYIDKAGKVTRIIEELDRPNGITVSPDGKTLYVAEPNHREVYSYEILAPGKLSTGKMIFKGEAEQDGTGPDGMTHDVDGNLYCTYNSLVVLNPEGEVLGRIPTPEKPSNCTFGDADNKTLYITARTSLYKIRLNRPGLPLEKTGPALPAQAARPAMRGNGLIVQTVAEVKADEKEEAKKEAKTVEVKAGNITLKVPETWESQPPSNNLRLAQFAIPNVKGETDETELVVFPPFGGSVNDNVVRWIRQFDPQGIKLTMLEGKGELGQYYYVDVAGTYKKPDGPPFLRKTIDAPDHRMLAVMLIVEGEGNYFLKLVGPAKTVAASAEAFRNSFGAQKDSEKEFKLED